MSGKFDDYDFNRPRSRIATAAIALVMLAAAARLLFDLLFHHAELGWKETVFDIVSVPTLSLIALLFWKTTANNQIEYDRRRAGRCPHCGYDLRASTDRCPECGRHVENGTAL